MTSKVDVLFLTQKNTLISRYKKISTRWSQINYFQLLPLTRHRELCFVLHRRLKEVKALQWSGSNTGCICIICSSRKNTDNLSTKLKIKSFYWHSCFEPREIWSQDEWTQCATPTGLMKLSQLKLTSHSYATRFMRELLFFDLFWFSVIV